MELVCFYSSMTFNIAYSNKNIPIPSENEYKLKLIMKTENFLKRMRWKALAFLGINYVVLNTL